MNRFATTTSNSIRSIDQIIGAIGTDAETIFIVVGIAKNQATPIATGLDRPLYLTVPSDDDRMFIVEKTGRIRLAAAQWEISVNEFAKSASADIEPSEVAKVQKKLDTARVRLAKQDNATGASKPE